MTIKDNTVNFVPIRVEQIKHILFLEGHLRFSFYVVLLLLFFDDKSTAFICSLLYFGTGTK